MQPIPVVASAQILHLFAGVCKRQEPVGVQANDPEEPVRGRNLGVIRLLARLAEVQGYTLKAFPNMGNHGF